MAPLALADHIQRSRVRFLQDALTTATAAHFERRGRAFEDAAPRPGDFNGNSTAAERAERRERCLATAAACYRHAWLLRSEIPESVSDEVRAVLEEVA